MPFYRTDALRVLYDAETIAARVRALGARITEDYRGYTEPLALVGVLKGSFVFLSDLARSIDLPVEIDFLGVSSYGDALESSGVVRMTQDLSHPVQGKHLLLVEDIVDTGLTLQYLLDNLRTRQPASLRIASLLHKRARTRVEVPVDYVGFEIPDEFVVGYGLDYGNRLRNLPFIGVVEGEGMPF